MKKFTPQSKNFESIAEEILNNGCFIPLIPGTTERQENLFQFSEIDSAFILCKGPETEELCPLIYIVDAAKNKNKVITNNGGFQLVRNIHETQTSIASLFKFHGLEFYEDLFFQVQSFSIIHELEIYGKLPSVLELTLKGLLQKEQVLRSGGFLTTTEIFLKVINAQIQFEQITENDPLYRIAKEVDLLNSVQTTASLFDIAEESSFAAA
ncbi:MAG: hypothetical protein GY793_10650 [Proteobacteria bacterium]|nr:hypothetical protein [Pseudomonadota bacterium]